MEAHLVRVCALLVLVLASTVSSQSQTTGSDLCKDSTSCKLDCIYGFALDKNKCEKCECQSFECWDALCPIGTECRVFNMTNIAYPLSRCVNPDSPPVCQMPMDMGPCMRDSMRWYYDDRSDTCEEFPYGGCQGNDNNFPTRGQCEIACKSDDLSYVEGCGYSICHLDHECPYGFTLDASGCEMMDCQCQPEVDLYDVFDEYEYDFDDEVNEDTSEDSEDCADLECKIQCVTGYEQDSTGCPTCSCVDFGVSECTPVSRDTCGWECDPLIGYAVGDDGCEICDCDWSRQCPREFVCDLTCPFGYIKDSYGCDGCECLEMGECNYQGTRTFCNWPECPYGFKQDDRGCDQCECADDPCEHLLSPCDAGTHCVSLESDKGQFYADCFPNKSWEEEPLEENVHKCYEVMCAMYCEYGNQVDEYGCEICRCRDELRCPVLQCEECEFGYAYNKDGCRSCQCMEDPCMGVLCGDGYVCESHSNEQCQDCRVTPQCIAHSDVMAASVKLDLSFPEESIVPEIDTLSLEQVVRNEISSWMNVNIRMINRFQLMLPVQDAPQSIHVSFCMIREGDTSVDLVQIYRRFVSQQESEILYGGLVIVPDTTSASVHYSSQPPATLQNTEARTSSSSHFFLYLILAGLLTTLLILTATFCAYKGKQRSRQRTQVVRERNIIYKPVNRDSKSPPPYHV